MWDRDFFYDDEFDSWEEECSDNCDFCGDPADGSFCANCHLDRVCHNCITECGNYCQDCKPGEIIIYNGEKDIVEVIYDDRAIPFGYVEVGDL